MEDGDFSTTDQSVKFKLTKNLKKADAGNSHLCAHKMTDL